MDTGKRYLQFLLLILQFLLMGISLWPAFWIVLRFSSMASNALHWVFLVLSAVLVFNYVYLIALLILRILVPIPKEGLFENSPGKPHRETVIFMLNALLVILRYRPPWAAFISSLLVNIFPLHYFYRRFFGPDTSSTTIGDNYICTEPYMLKAGKNVQFGAFSAIAGHTTYGQSLNLFIKRVEIGDNVIIGGYAKIGAGVKIGHNSIIEGNSAVLPGTVIGDNEYWAGSPARRRKYLDKEKSALA